jgi:leader peptidase (prepilin peptidase)/N-methyltransferase
MQCILYTASGWLAGGLVNLYISRRHSGQEGRPLPIGTASKLAMSAISLLMFYRYGTGLYTVKLMILGWLLAAAAFIDLYSNVIPDLLNVIGFAAGIVLGYLEGPVAIGGYIAGLITGGGVLLAIALLSKGGIGGGDVKLMAVIGAYLGWRQALAVLFLAFVSGGAVAVLLVLSRKKGMKDIIPFGPFLGLAGVVTALFGQSIIHHYLGLY